MPKKNHNSKANKQQVVKTKPIKQSRKNKSKPAELDPPFEIVKLSHQEWDSA